MLVGLTSLELQVVVKNFSQIIQFCWDERWTLSLLYPAPQTLWFSKNTSHNTGLDFQDASEKNLVTLLTPAAPSSVKWSKITWGNNTINLGLAHNRILSCDCGKFWTKTFYLGWLLSTNIILTETWSGNWQQDMIFHESFQEMIICLNYCNCVDRMKLFIFYEPWSDQI